MTSWYQNTPNMQQDLGMKNRGVDPSVKLNKFYIQDWVPYTLNMRLQTQVLELKFLQNQRIDLQCSSQTCFHTQINFIRLIPLILVISRPNSSVDIFGKIDVLTFNRSIEIFCLHIRVFILVDIFWIFNHTPLQF